MNAEAKMRKVIQEKYPELLPMYQETVRSIREEGYEAGFYDGDDDRRCNDDGHMYVRESLWFFESLHGLLHREDGPAVEWSNGGKEWYLNGKRVK